MSEDDWGKKPERTKGGQFKKDSSGNPRGRPPNAERTYTHGQIRHDVLGLMEEKIELKVQGKLQRVPIILGIYWKMFQKALEGDQKMILAVAQLRHDLVHEHTRKNFELIDELERHERELRKRGASETVITQLLNELRAKTKKV